MDPKKFSFVFWNVVSPLLCIFFAFANFVKFLSAGGQLQISHLLLGIQFVLIAFFFMFRRPAVAVSWKPVDLTASLLGSWAPFLFSFGDGTAKIYALILQCIGNAMTLYATLSLGRSFGILPANRGIQSRGMYRFIRHPLYLSYTIANIGYVLNHAGIYNVGVAAVCFLSQLLRIYSEERILDHDPAYLEFKKKVPWRLIPFVF